MRGLRVLQRLQDNARKTPIQPTPAARISSTTVDTSNADSSGGGGKRRDGGGGGAGTNFTAARFAAAAVGAAALAALNERKPLAAKEEGSAHLHDHAAYENRVRLYQTPDMVFTYFATYRNNSSKGRLTNMMSPMDLYRAVTPDCKRFGAGHPDYGDYIEITDQDIIDMHLPSSKVEIEKSPVKNSVLNRIGESGLITYADFCFLLALLSTPTRYIDTAFQVFDVNGNNRISLEEFTMVSLKNALKSGGFGNSSDLDIKEALHAKSGLLVYLFGEKRDKEVTTERFKQLQKDLLDELIELQFLEYDKEKTGKISELDFATFLLKNGRIPKKKKASLLKTVRSLYPAGKGKGITFNAFKNVFYILAGGGELERALFYLDVEGNGVDQEEFRKIASYVSGEEICPHVTEVIFSLLDDDGDKRLQKAEISFVLLDWRNSRGFDKALRTMVNERLREEGQSYHHANPVHHSTNGHGHH